MLKFLFTMQERQDQSCVDQPRLYETKVLILQDHAQLCDIKLKLLVECRARNFSFEGRVVILIY